MTHGTRQQPNILWICTDQQRVDTLGCYGNPYVNTPNIDRLAEMGVVFENTYCQSPVCSPSRGSFLTGRYPSTCRLRQNGQSLPPDEVLVTKVLSEAGYKCGLSGKLHLAACHPSVCQTIEKRNNDGYSEFHWSHGPGHKSPSNEYLAWLKEQGIDYQARPYQDQPYVQEGMPSDYHQTKWCTDKALEFIERAQNREDPWLFSVNIFDPHHPFDPPLEYLQPYLDRLDAIPLPDYREDELLQKPIFQQKDHFGAYGRPGFLAYTDMTSQDHRMLRAAYWAMIDQIDAQVGRLLDALERTGQLDDTLVIFTSDHGEMLGDHGIYLKGPYFYEAAVHVPLIIAWPGTIKGNRRSGALVELMDIAPTLLHAAGLDVPTRMQGQSLWPILTQVVSADFHRSDVYCEFYNASKSHRSPKAFLSMLFDGRYKFVQVHGWNAEAGIAGELYDLQRDPGEQNNLWANGDYIDIKMHLLERLCDRIAMTADPLPEREAAF